MNFIGYSADECTRLILFGEALLRNPFILFPFPHLFIYLFHVVTSFRYSYLPFTCCLALLACYLTLCNSFAYIDHMKVFVSYNCHLSFFPSSICLFGLSHCCLIRLLPHQSYSFSIYFSIRFIT